LNYGPRLTSPPPSGAVSDKLGDRQNRGENKNPKAEAPKAELSSFDGILDKLTSYRVPHAYFKHFYLCSVGSSILWLQQILTKGVLFRYIAASAMQKRNYNSSMTPGQVLLIWTLMFAQGSRRLYESIVFANPKSKSEMWVPHYILGLLFYIAVNMSLWIEGVRTLTLLILCWWYPIAKS
jgi:3-oxo-5-alpha-steroid 4-dehydrogenase 3 / polyprenol reductase